MSDKLVDEIIRDLTTEKLMPDIKINPKGPLNAVAKRKAKMAKIMAALKEGNNYQEYFKSMLAKHGIKSPNELDDIKKKVFFDDVKKGWSAKKS